MKTISLLILCFIQIIVCAQDTIYKRTGELVSAKILEINIKEISYKRTDLPDGPLIIVNKNDIRKIKYATGMVDSFAIIKPDPPRQVFVNTPSYVYQDNNNLIHPSLRKGTYQYMGHRISDRNVLLLAIEKNQQWKNKEIDLNISASRRNKALQYSIGYAGAFIGGLGVYSCILAIDMSSRNPTGESAAVVGCLLSAGVLVSSQIVSFTYKLKRVKHADKVAELYNNQLSKH